MSNPRRLAGGLLLLMALLLVGGAASSRAESVVVSLRSSQPSPVSGAVLLTAEVAPDPGMLGVQFKLDGHGLETPDTTPPYEVVWSAAGARRGEHTLTAEAHYRSGAVVASAPLRLTVANPPTFNRTFYVDAEHGRDGQEGVSPATAWRTLGKANRSVAPGDTVLLQGVFTAQHIRPAVSGTPAKPITFTSHPGQTAVLKGGSAGVAVRLEGLHDIVIERLRIQGVPGDAVQMTAGSHHNVVRDTSITGTTRGAPSWGYAMRITESSDNLIEGNQISDTGDEATNSGDSIFIANGASRNRVLNNTLRNGGHGLILIGGDKPNDAEALDNVVAGNVLANPWTTPLLLGWTARRTLVERNRISDAARHGVNYPRPGIQLNASDSVVRDNEVFNNAGAGLLLAAYVYRAPVMHDAIGNSIYNNVFHGNGAAGLWISEKDGRAVRDNLIANNIFFRNGGFVVDGRAYTIGIEHYHNPTAWPVGSLNGNRLVSNIFLRQPGTAGEPLVLRIRTTSQGGNLTYTLAHFQKTHREATDNFEADPQFTDEGKGVFTLRPGSPALNRGLRIPGVAAGGPTPPIGLTEVDR